MQNIAQPPFKRSSVYGVLPVILLLAGCQSPTTVLSSANPSRAPASEWTDYASLPVELHGVVPGHTKQELASIFPADRPIHYASLNGGTQSEPERRMVLYVNPIHPLDQAHLCDGGAGFQRGPQVGQSAFVSGALCEGPRVISRATAFILSRDDSMTHLSYNFNMIRDQLYQSLFPGANDPGRLYQ